MTKKFPYRLYLVTDELACLDRDFYWVVEEAINGGVDIVQLREKKLDDRQFLQKAEKLKVICDRYKVPLIINDNVNVAQWVEADGIHVGQSDTAIHEVQKALGVDFPIGLSIEKMNDIKDPNSNLAWYYGVSPVFSTPTKTDTISEWGLEGLSELKTMSTKALIAIGNIKIQNAASVIAAGADCLAVVSGICSAESPAKAAELFRKEIDLGLKIREK